MKYRKHKIFITLLLTLFSAMPSGILAQEAAPETSYLLGIQYHAEQNRLPYLLVQAKTKTGRKFENIKGVKVTLWLDSIDAASGPIASVVTNGDGAAGATLPPSLASAWNALPTHNFIAVAEKDSNFDATETELSITKAKLSIDTTGDGETRSITATLVQHDGTTWVPVPDAEVKIGIRRLGGLLSAGDDEVYTTNEEGVAEAEFTKTGIPGDDKGNLVIVAEVEDNETLGTLVIETTVPWGSNAPATGTEFGERSLWATRDKAPVWLLTLAISIMAGVWGVIIYLVRELIKMKKLGKVAGP